MFYGRMSRSLLLIFFALAGFLPIFAAPPAHARPAPASEITVTLLSVGPGSLQVQGADGRAFAVKITPATWVLGRGLVIGPRDLAPGEALRVRLGRSAALSVCDADTAAAIDAHRQRPLTGTVLSAGGTVWTVQPDDGPIPLTLCLTGRTTFRAGGSPVAASAFGAGAQVTITTRGLANGLLAAVSVSDALPSAAGPAERAPSRSVSGTLTDVRPDLGLLTLQDAAGGSQTVAVDAGTQVKFGGRAASPGGLAAGMHVRVRLGAGQDAAGNPVATGVSASAAKPARKASKRTRG